MVANVRVVSPCLAFTAMIIPVVVSHLVHCYRLRGHYFHQMDNVNVFGVKTRTGGRSVSRVRKFSHPIEAIVFVVLVRFRSGVTIFSLL